jgi:hypothetical protein
MLTPAPQMLMISKLDQEIGGYLPAFLKSFLHLLLQFNKKHACPFFRAFTWVFSAFFGFHQGSSCFLQYCIHQFSGGISMLRMCFSVSECQICCSFSLSCLLIPCQVRKSPIFRGMFFVLTHPVLKQLQDTTSNYSCSKKTVC